MPFLRKCFWVLIPLNLAGQQPADTIKAVRAFSVIVQKGTVFIQKPVVQGARGAVPFSVGADYFVQQLDSSSYHYCGAFIRTGVSLNFTDFQSQVVGRTITGAVFIEPVYRINHWLQYQFRAASGIAYATTPFDPVHNTANQTYSTHLNTYLHLSTGFGFRITKKIVVDFNGHIHHISNANFKQPNGGLNWLTLSGSVIYYPNGNRLPVYIKRKGKSIHSRVTLDAGLMFTPGQGYHQAWKTKRNYMAGLFLQVSKVISRINALTAGTELSYDRFRDDETAGVKNSRPAMKAGLSAGNEFLMGRFTCSQQLGIYITRHPAFITSVYHRWGIRYRLSTHMYAGISLKVHREIADLVDLRVQYRF
jgi:hypothetical protein